MAGFLATAGAMLLFAIARGSSISAMIEWMIVIPRSVHGRLWYLSLEMPSWYTIWAALCVVVALAAQTRHADSTPHRRLESNGRSSCDGARRGPPLRRPD